MILSGEKKEEYREVKPYWSKRLLTEHFDVIEFRNGYSKDCRKFRIECTAVEKAFGIIEWGAPWNKLVYILYLGKIIEGMKS